MYPDEKSAQWDVDGKMRNYLKTATLAIPPAVFNITDVHSTDTPNIVVTAS